ncbi:uncharacterized protein LOC142578258 [Dermacentor variabilis]|uniref:uncharacterized protein LOC142578258 n=1 Tax=Dermacentor variabilis TaxID=34621 RepID=UPI003F5C3B71
MSIGRKTKFLSAFFPSRAAFASVKPFEGLFAIWLGASPTVIGLVTFAVCVLRLPLKVVICLLADVRYNICILIALAAFAEGSLSFYMSFMRPTHMRRTHVFELSTNYSNAAGSRIICFPLRLKHMPSGLGASELTCRLSCGCTDDPAKYPTINSALNSSFLYEHQGRCMSSRSFDELLRDYYCEISNEYACRMQCRPADDALSGGALWNYGAAYALSGLAMSSMTPLSDAAAFLVIDKTGKELAAVYSNYRLWGAVGSGVVAVAAGYANERSGDSFGTLDFTSGFYINASLSTLDMITILYVAIPRRMRREEYMEAVDSLLASPRSVLLLVTLFVVGFLSPVCSLLGFVYLQDLGAGHTLVGIVVAAQCLLGQLLSLSAAEVFFKRLRQGVVLSITLGASAVRCLAFALAQNTWHVIPAELAYGFWYGLFCASNAAYACNEAHLVAQATVQCILGVALEEFGAGIGSLVGGLCFTHVGRRQTYLYFLAISLAYTLLHIPLEMYITSFEKKAGKGDQVTSPWKTPTPCVHSVTAEQCTDRMTLEISEIHDHAGIMATETGSHAAPDRLCLEASTATSAGVSVAPSQLTLAFPQAKAEDDVSHQEYLRDMVGKPETPPEGDQPGHQEDGAAPQPPGGANCHEQPPQGSPAADEKTAHALRVPPTDVGPSAVGGGKDVLSTDGLSSPRPCAAEVASSNNAPLTPNKDSGLDGHKETERSSNAQHSRQKKLKRRKSKGVYKTERRKKKSFREEDSREPHHRKQPAPELYSLQHESGKGGSKEESSAAANTDRKKN